MTRIALALALLVGCDAQTNATSSERTGPAPVATPEAAPPPAPPAVVAAKPPAPAPPAPAATPAAKPPTACDPFADLAPRKEGDLAVPALSGTSDGGRFRSNVEGRLVKGDPRVWTGPAVPTFVPLYRGAAELFLLDRVGDLFVASYRDPYEAGSCSVPGHRNCNYVVAAFDRCGKGQWEIGLNDAMSATEHLEVGDVQYEDGILYFVEACQSYSKEAKGKCSAIVALDPTTGKVKWRTKHLVARDGFLLDPQYIVSVYDFSGEPAVAYVIRKTDGKILLKQPVEAGNWDIRVHADGHLQLAAFGDSTMHYEMIDWGTDKPKLKRVPGYAG